MIAPLTAEEIPQLDTFTLEQKIEELELHPNRHFFAQIIKIAKLQLIDRLQIQEFGRKLANDELKIQDFFKLPAFPEPKIQKQTILPAIKSRKDFAIRLQMNQIASNNVVKIGKPNFDHRYKPKKQKIQPVQKTRNFLKAKKKEGSLSKVKMISCQQNQQKIKKQNPLKKSEEIIEFEQKKVPLKEISQPNIIEDYTANLKQKLKQEVKNCQSYYQQNDVYEDVKGIKVQPYNLIEQQENIEIIQQSFVNSTEESPNIKQIKQQIEENGKINQYDQYNNQKQEKKSNLFENESNTYKSNYDQRYFTQKIRQSKAKDFIDQGQTTQLNFQFTNSPKIQEYKTLLTEKIQTNIFSEIQKDQRQKQIRSKSLKNLQPKQSIETTDQQEFQYNTNPLVKQISFKINKTKGLIFNVSKNEPKFKTHAMNTKSTVFNSAKYQSTNKIKNQNVFPYHQLIPSFQRLFPHSKNILNTYRTIEQHLRIHLNKQINEKCLANEYLKLNQNDLTFKIISECEKAKKYKDYFNIQLQSFHQRGSTMLERVKYHDDTIQKDRMLLYRVVRTKEQVYDIINSSFYRTKSWFELPHGMELKLISWNLLWTWSKPQIDFQDLFLFQKVNHFIGNKQIARKDLLKKNIESVQKLGPKMKIFFDIIPQTFLLPGENIQFIKKFRQNELKDSHNFWIMKPVGLSRGRGISLINKLQQITISEPIVLQRYLMNPLLINGFKFDMRIYVLVTSMNPLQVFLYKQGFARLSTEKYSTDEAQMDNKFIHLTNFSIQKQNISDKKMTHQQQLGGCKITLKILAEKLSKMNVDWSHIEKQIQQIILKSLVACMNTIPQNPNCFQLFGYDIFIDANLKCWLIQINSSPSLQKQYTFDEIVKQQLVDDIIEIVNPMNFDRSRLLDVIERRRKETEGLKSAINTNNNSSYQLNQDLHYILHGQKLRKYGEKVKNQNFKMIAPSEKYHQIVKNIQHYKIQPIIKAQY